MRGLRAELGRAMSQGRSMSLGRAILPWAVLVAGVLLATGCKHADSTKAVGQEAPPAAGVEAPAAAAPQAAAPAKQPDLPAGVDAKDLDDAEKKLLLEVLTEQFDPCGKTRSFLDALRAGDCSTAPKLATKLVEALRSGMGKKQAVAALLREIERLNTVVEIDVKGSPFKGPADAKVVIVEFSDFECPFCRRVAKPMDQLAAHYNVALYYKFFPLRHAHPNAEGAAKAAWAAHQQGKFWPLHDLFFANQGPLDWAGVKKLAGQAGLDLKKLEADMATPAAAAAVTADEKAGNDAGVDGTPTFFVNGHKAESLAQVEEAVREALAAAKLPLPAPLSADVIGEAEGGAGPHGAAAAAAPTAPAPAAPAPAAEPAAPAEAPAK